MFGVCTPNMQFIYVIPLWECSTTYRVVLKNAISGRNWLKILKDKSNVIELLDIILWYNSRWIFSIDIIIIIIWFYYLCDVEYTINGEGFFAPHKEKI